MSFIVVHATPDDYGNEGEEIHIRGDQIVRMIAREDEAERRTWTRLWFESGQDLAVIETVEQLQQLLRDAR